MKRLRCILLLFALSVLGNSILAQTLTLAECHRRLNEVNPVARAATPLQQISQLQQRELIISYLPRLSFGGQATYQSEKVEMTIPIINETRTLAEKFQFNVWGEVAQLIWAGGGLRRQQQLNQLELQAESERLSTQLDALHQTVNDLYFSWLLVNQQDSLVDLMDNLIDKQLDRLRSLRNNGMIGTKEIDQLEIERLNLQQQRAQIRSARAEIADGLSSLLDTTYSPTTPLARPEFILSDSVPNPQLKMLETKVALFDTRSDLLTSTLMPQFMAFARGGYGRPGINFIKNEADLYWIVGVTMKWDLGNLSSISLRNRVLRLQKSVANLTLEAARMEDVAQRNKGQRELSKYNELLKFDNQIVELRQRVAETTDAEVKNGTAVIADWITAHTKWQEACLAKARHEVQRLRSAYAQQHYN